MNPSILDCDEIELSGDSSTHQHVFVLAAVPTGVTGLQFGISYDESVQVVSWAGCGAFDQIAEDGWPSSGTGTAIAWDDCTTGTGPENLILLGYFVVDPASSGHVRVVPDPRTGVAAATRDGAPVPGATTCEDTRDYFVYPADFGVVGVNGEAGLAPCDSAGGGESPPATSDMATFMASRDRECVLARAVYGSDSAVVGRVIEVSPDTLAPFDLSTIRRKLPVAVTPWLLEYPASAELVRRVDVDVSRTLQEEPRSLRFYIHDGFLSERGTALIGRGGRHQYKIGEEYVFFYRLVDHPELGGIPVLTIPEYNLAADDQEALEQLWSVTSALDARRSQEAIESDADEFVEAVFLGRSPFEERATSQRGYELIELGVIDGPAELRGSASVTAACSFRYGHAIGPVACDVPLFVVEPGDTVRVGLCHDPVLGLYVCNGGWSVLRKAGGSWFHGYQGRERSE